MKCNTKKMAKGGKIAAIPVPGRSAGRPASGMKPFGTKPMSDGAKPGKTKPMPMPAMKKGGLVPFMKKGK